ncbi:hypothetical protein [Streptomyces triticagri]|uniref:hypothetical protein n=1 Tax=Streptomyces triticagri TaxID=2293568 RepID=UPI000FFC6D4C|nr:hypothetical protein [Streptomyces triticagri]
MAESGDAQKLAAWLGVVVSIIAVLGFFGIDRFDDLKRAVASPEQAEACEKARAAVGDAADAPSLRVNPAKYSPLAGALREAAGLTEDKELGRRLHASAEAFSAYTRALVAEDTKRAWEAHALANQSQESWTSYCKANGV